MTVLMGMYNDDRTDVALISDRRAIPNEIGAARGVSVLENTIKTLKLNDACAIGFAGFVPLENALLSRILSVPMPPQYESLLVKLAENEGRWPLLTFNVLVEEIRRVMPEIIARLRPPRGVWLGVLVAGVMSGGFPMLAAFSGGEDWEPAPCFTGQAYFVPFSKTDKKAKEEFERVTNVPGEPFGKRLKAAIEYCACRYDSVNSRYIIRRLLYGFREEEGTIHETSKAYERGPDSHPPSRFSKMLSFFRLRRDPENPLVQKNFMVPSKLLARLQLYAEKARLSESEVIRKAVEEWLNAHEKDV